MRSWLGPVVEAVAALLAEAAELLDHQRGDMVGGARNIFVAEILLRLAGVAQPGRAADL